MRFLSIFCSIAFASSAWAATDRVIHVEVNKGEMVRLETPANSVMVADPSIADIQVVSPKMIYVNAKKIGETSIYALGNNDATVLDATIEVTHNLSRLNRTIKQMVPDADVQLKSIDGGMVLEGFVDTPMQSETVRSIVSGFMGREDRLVNMMSTNGSDQVTLMVKVAEVSRNELKRFGIHLENFVNTGNFLFSLAQGRDFTGAGGSLLRNGSDSSLFGAFNTGNTSIQGVIDALESQGLVSVLAEPSLTTTSGKTANFLAGGEFPIPLVDADGQITVQYKSFGISLNFTPTVLAKEKISLAVSPEVSNIAAITNLQTSAATTFAVPTLQTRRAQTTVELGSGQTFAIAGLFKNDRSNSVDRFPGLGELPVLGALFRSQQFRNDQSELVILVTPYVVRPVSEKLATPLDGYTPPTDLERILLAKHYQQAPIPSERESASTDLPELHGDGGFILQ